MSIVLYPTAGKVQLMKFLRWIFGRKVAARQPERQEKQPTSADRGRARQESRLAALTAEVKAWRDSRSPTTPPPPSIGQALKDMQHLLAQLNRPRDRANVGDEIVALYGDSPTEGDQHRVALALLSKGNALGWPPLSLDEAFAAFDEMVARFGRNSNSDITDAVFYGLRSKADILRRLSRPAEALAVYDQMAGLYGARTDRFVAMQVIEGLEAKADLAKELAERDAAYSQIIALYGTWTDEEILGKVEAARLRLGTE